MFTRGACAAGQYGNTKEAAFGEALSTLQLAALVQSHFDYMYAGDMTMCTRICPAVSNNIDLVESGCQRLPAMVVSCCENVYTNFAGQ